VKVLNLPPAAYLRECLQYDPLTGLLSWNKRPLEHFSSEREWKRWNTRYAGTLALNDLSQPVRGYKKGNIDGVRYKAHRVIWKLVTGEEPGPEIDHRDRDESNNRWKNLREATRSQNCGNRVFAGDKGIGQRRGKWHVRVYKDKACHYIGGLSSKAEAISVRDAKAQELYGEFAA
jgi:hypothetical protein